MVDLVALPVWVGALIQYFKFTPQQAGGMATLFLLGAVVASLALAPRFGRLSNRMVAACGFGVSALAFFGASLHTDFATMAALHGLAGLATGSALSVTHGTIARGTNPHRGFAVVGMAHHLAARRLVWHCRYRLHGPGAGHDFLFPGTCWQRPRIRPGPCDRGSGRTGRGGAVFQATALAGP
jgi:hypothetical protein